MAFFWIALVVAVLFALWLTAELKSGCPRCWHPTHSHTTGTCIKCLDEDTECHWRPQR